MATQRHQSIPVGVVLRRTPGVTRWEKWAWKAVAVLPGAETAHWKVMREEDGATEYHVGTLSLDLYRTDTEAYLTALNNDPAVVYVVLRQPEFPTEAEPLELHAVTASPYEAQDHLDNGEDIVEAVPMPIGLAGWIAEFCQAHHVEEPFVKRKRRNWSDAVGETGKGDIRVRQAADVYRAPSTLRKDRLN